MTAACLETLEGRVLLSAATLLGPAVPYTTDYQPCAVALGDFNHDGTLDMVTVNGTSNVDPGSISELLGNGDGTFQPAISIQTDIAPAAVVVGRFNDDAYDDIAVACYDSNPGGGTAVVDVFLGTSDGTFVANAPIATPDSPASMVAADFNGDGYDDLAVSSEEDDLDQNLAIFMADGGGSGAFTLNNTYASYWGEGVTAGYFNGDDHVDLAVLNQWDAGHQNTSTVTIFDGLGDGIFERKDTYVLNDGATGIASGDLNGDGYADLAITCRADAKLDILLGANDGTFVASPAVDTSSSPEGIAMSDFDNDGLTDVVMTSSSADSVQVKLGDGAGGFRDIGNGEVETGPGAKGIAVGDFNGDRLTDVVTTDQQGSAASVLLGVGPKAADWGFMINKNATYTFSKKTFLSAFSDSNQLALASVKIVSLPSDGVLSYRGKPVTAGQVIATAQLGNLKYKVNKGYGDVDGFTWRAYDGAAYSGLANVECITTPEATISGGAAAAEGNPGTASSFTVHLNHAALGDVTIHLTAKGHAAKNKNYLATPKTVTIPAGAISATFALTPLVDGVAKGDVDVIEKISGGRGYTVGAAKSATVMIVDDEPKLSITASVASAQLAGNSSGEFTLTLSHTMAQDVVVTLVRGGSAKGGRDYQALAKTVTIPAGSTFAKIAVAASLNPAKNRTVTLTAKVTKTVFSLSPLAKSALVTILHTV